MLKMGITGGIGSGKTTVCRMFESLQIPVYYADDRAKWLMENDNELKAAIENLLGPMAYDANGHLQRALIAEKVFAEPELLNKLNALVHPAVFQDGEKWFAEHIDEPYALKEAALIYESGGNHLLDGVIVVTAPEPLRIARVVARDGVEEEAVKARIARQMPEEEKVKLADYIIINDGQQDLLPQVWRIHRELCARSEQEANS